MDGETMIETSRKQSVTSQIEEKMNAVEKKTEKSGLKGDYGNLCLLLLLYVLQGIPMGLMHAIPMILTSNGVKYEKQAILSVANYPQATKLVWAPIVDSVYSKRFGRRKSWLIPIQYCIGGSLILISSFTDDLIGSKTTEPMIYLLTAAMFFIVLLTAIQDTAVDSWGLTLLQKHNVHYVASANAVGMVLGALISTVLFLSLESAEFCNKWLRSVPKETGIINIQTFFFLIGALFAVSTTIIWIFKREENSVAPGEETKGPIHTYKLLFRILKLRSVLWLTLIQFTQFVGVAVFFAASELKIIQFGVRRETLSIMKAPISVINIFLPFIVVHLTKKAPLIYFWKFGVIRQFAGILMIFLVYWTQTFNKPIDGFPIHFYAVMLIAYVIYDIIIYSNFMSMWAYFTLIADPKIGATYMTLFSTLAHIGMKMTATISLALIDPLTISRTVNVMKNVTINSTTTDVHLNETIVLSNSTMLLQPEKQVIVDGFYIQAVFCTIFGLIWFVVFKKIVWRMQNWPLNKWRLKEWRVEPIDNNKELNISLMAVSATKSDDN